METSKSSEPAQWCTVDEFDNDMLEFSDISSPGAFKTITPPSIINWYNRVSKIRKKSIFDEDVLDPDKSYFVSGRGRGGRNVAITPGIPVKTNPQDIEEIQKKLRGLTGFGYCNQFIENTLRANHQNQKKKFQKQEIIFEDDSTPSSSSVNSPAHKTLISDSEDEQFKPLLSNGSPNSRILKSIEKNIIESEETTTPYSLDKKNFPDLARTTSPTSESSSSDLNWEGKTQRRCRGRGKNRRFVE